TGQGEPGDTGSEQPREHQVGQILQAHMVAPVAGGDETVRAVQVASFGDLHEGLALIPFYGGPEVTGACVSVDDERFHGRSFLPWAGLCRETAVISESLWGCLNRQFQG